MTGLVSGLIRLVLDFVYPEPNCWEEDTRPDVIAKVHYMYFAMILFFQGVIVMVVVSLLTKPEEPWRLVRTVFSKRFNKTIRPDDVPMDICEEEQAEHEETAEPGETIELAERNGEFEIEVEQKDKPKKNLAKTVFEWFCGFSWDSEEENKDEGVAVKTAHEIEVEEEAEKEAIKMNVDRLVESIRQPKTSRIILNINCVMIVIIATAAFIIFSLPPEDIGLLPSL